MISAPFYAATALDRSGSMASIRNELIRAANGHVARLKANEASGAAALNRAL